MLRGTTRYWVGTEEGYVRLYRRLTAQPEVRKPKLGERRVLSPKDLEANRRQLTGGATEKFETRYETFWTIFCMLDIMDNRAHSIRLEFPGEEEEGVEFHIRRDGAQRTGPGSSGRRPSLSPR